MAAVTSREKTTCNMQRIHLFQKTLSERTANGSCRTEIARPKGTVVSIYHAKTMSSSRGAKLGSLSKHDDESNKNSILHI